MKDERSIISSILRMGGVFAVCLIIFPGRPFSKEIGINNSNYASGQILISFTADTSEIRKSEIRHEVGAELIKIVKSIRVEFWQLPDEITTDEAIDYLNSLSEIEYIEPNYLYKPQTLPNDPQFNKLWFLKNTGQSVNGLSGIARADISASAAWDIETGSHDIVIAVIDSGVAFDHPDLQNNIWVNQNEIPDNSIDDDHNGYVDDRHGWDFVNDDNNPLDYSRDLYGDGHGTHVAGIIAAEGDNNIGVCGVMWHAQIMPLQIFDIFKKNSYFDNLIQLINILDAIEYAVNNGAKVINCSFGSRSYSQSQYDIISYANQHGVLVVCSAGNDGMDTDESPQYPSCYNLPNIISVAATDESDNLASYSNYGINSVDVAAPGGSGLRGNIYSTVPPERITLFYDDFESTNNKWLTNGLYENWSVGYDFFWSSYLQDSVGDYHTDEDSKVWTKDTINATNCRGLFFEYDLNYSLETDYDFFDTEISWDGNNYISIMEYTGFSDGWIHQSLWYNELNLGSFYLRFHLVTDYSYNYNGIMLDEVKITGIPWFYSGDEYGYKSGTSMAAPVVSGIAGLTWSLFPSLTHLEVKKRILSSVDKIETLNGKVKAGGRVNAENVLKFCLYLHSIIDFNADGSSDILWRNDATGVNYLWYFDGLSYLGGASVSRLGDTNWNIVGLADFNSDGHPDILWRNTSTGDNYVWYMDDNSKIGGHFINKMPDTDWHIVGVSDFNGDTHPDILWRNMSTGANSLWYLDDCTRIGTHYVASLSDTDWNIVGTADFNSDSHPDILWRNYSTGENYIYYMNDWQKTGSHYVSKVSDVNWAVGQLSDFNSDGQVDILWRNQSTGDNYIWYLNDWQKTGGASFKKLSDLNWHMAEER